MDHAGCGWAGIPCPACNYTAPPRVRCDRVISTADQAFRPYNRDNGIEPAGPVWTLHKGKRAATCALTTHPRGWELAVCVGDELYQSQVCNNETLVLDTADAWRHAWAGKGWDE